MPYFSLSKYFRCIKILSRMYWKRGPAGSCLLRRPAEDLELRGFLSRRAFVRLAAGCRALVIVNKIVLLKLSPEIVEFFFFFLLYRF